MRALASAALLLAAAPLGAQVKGAPTDIPTLDEYGIIGLILLLVIAAAVFVHRRSK